MTKNTIDYWRERAHAKRDRFDKRYVGIPKEANVLLTIHDLMQEADSYIQAGFSVWGTLLEFFPKNFNGLYHLSPGENQLISLASYLNDPKESRLDLSRHELVIPEIDLVETIKGNKKYMRKVGGSQDLFFPLQGKHEIKEHTGYPENPDCIIGSLRFYAPERGLKGVDLERIASRPGVRLHQGHMLREFYRSNKRLEDVNEYMIEVGKELSHDSKNKALYVVAKVGSVFNRIPKEMEKERRILESVKVVAKELEDKLSAEALNLAEMGTHGMIKSNVNLYKILESVLSPYDSEAEIGGIRLKKNLLVKEALTSGNKNRLTSAFENLADNAKKYGDGNIEVCLEDYDRKKYKISFKNTGRGISQDRMKTIFQDGVIGDDSKGLGLGLGIVENVIKLHKGRIEVESDGRTYSQFNVFLNKL